MVQGYLVDAKVYTTEDLKKLSILDMLTYFREKGVMQVSDLHLKVGAPPSYRVNGDLVKLKGTVVTEDVAKKLIYPLLSDDNLSRFENQYSVDLAQYIDSLQ